jgi:hypothetical protein
MSYMRRAIRYEKGSERYFRELQRGIDLQYQDFTTDLQGIMVKLLEYHESFEEDHRSLEAAYSLKQKLCSALDDFLPPSFAPLLNTRSPARPSSPLAKNYTPPRSTTRQRQRNSRR